MKVINGTTIGFLTAILCLLMAGVVYCEREICFWSEWSTVPQCDWYKSECRSVLHRLCRRRQYQCKYCDVEIVIDEIETKPPSDENSFCDVTRCTYGMTYSSWSEWSDWNATSCPPTQNRQRLCSRERLSILSNSSCEFSGQIDVNIVSENGITCIGGLRVKLMTLFYICAGIIVVACAIFSGVRRFRMYRLIQSREQPGNTSGFPVVQPPPQLPSGAYPTQQVQYNSPQAGEGDGVTSPLMPFSPGTETGASVPQIPLVVAPEVNKA